MAPSRGFHSDNFWVNKNYDERMERERMETAKASEKKTNNETKLKNGTAEIVEISDRIKLLYGKNTKDAYKNLQELEALSEKDNVLYLYTDEFIAMLKNKQYSIRVRGFRLLCKQAKWDNDNKINTAIDDIAAALNDEKPTAIRQALQYLMYVVLYKKELNDKIREAVLSIDLSRFKDTMRPLIAKDIQVLLQLIEE